MAIVGWDQSRFDSTLKELLSKCETEKWPRAVNKHGFFVALAALQITERASPEKMFQELGREIVAVRKDSTSGPIPISIAIAAKRASKGWTGQRNLSGMSPSQRKKAAKQLSLDNWRKLFAKKLESMLKGRQASTAFIKSGWLTVVQKLGPIIGGRYDRSGGRGVPVRGSAKGRVDPAVPGKLNVMIEDSAASRTEKRGGFHRTADPAFQRALDRETNSMIKHLEDEMKEPVARFNRQQH